MEFLLDLLKVYSPTGQEAELAKLLYLKMKELGFEVHIDSVGNVIGELKGHGPTVLLCGHMDTVPGFIPVRIENEEIWGRGAVDAKGPLAALIMAAKKYLSLERRGLNVIIACVVEEEGSSKGMYRLIDSINEPDIAIFGEPSGVSCLTLGYKGGVTFEVTVETEGGHSASPWLFKNSIEEGWSLWTELKKVLNSHKKEDSKFYSITYCLTYISGGGPSALVPSKCIFKFNVRIPPMLKCKDVVKMVRDVAEYFASSRGVKVEVKWDDCVEAYVLSRTSTVARAFSRAMLEELGAKPSFVYKTGTSDINVAATKWTQAEMAAYGPGDSSLDHTPWERVSINEYLKSINVLWRALTWIDKFKSKAFLLQDSL
ncbi:MAG: M20/M25/M40 family metallo-hydrolase [Candidatus Nezhaarchaeales archaeon]